MDQIFPPVDSGAEAASSMQELSSRSKSRKVTTKQKLMDSFGFDLNSNAFSKEEEEEKSSATPEEEAEVQCGREGLAEGEQSEVKCQINTSHTDQDSSARTQNHTAGDLNYPSHIRIL